MALNVWQRSVVNEAGNVMPLASVEVRDQVTSNLVQLYSDYDGASPIGNPTAADADGFVRFYADTGRYRITATSGAVSRVWEDEVLGLPAVNIKHDRTAAEISAGVTPTALQYLPGDVRRYGAVGDDATNDLTALRAAVSQFEQAGGAALWFEPGKTYFVGDATGSPVLFSIDSVVDGKVIYGNGAQLRTNTTDDGAPVMVQFNNCRGIVVKQLRVQDDGWDPTAVGSPAGVVAFDVRASGATDEDIGHITFEDCELDQGVMLLRVAGDATGQVSTNTVNRIRNVRVRGGRCVRSFYVANLQNHGDDTSIDCFVEDVHRSIFFYGVTGLDCTEHVKNPRGGYAHILCKAYDRSTEGARIRIYLESAVSSFEAVLFEFQNDTQDESIRDIEIDLNMRNTASGTIPLTFRALQADATPRATTTNRWDNIRLRGDWTGFTDPIAFTTRQTTEGRLILDPSLANQLATFQDLTGFVLLTALDTEVRSVTGDLTSKTITIPCARYDAQAFELEVTTSIRDDTDGGTSAAATLTQRDIIKASNSGAGGAVSVLDTLNLFRFVRVSSTITALGVITYTASGENINMTFSVHSDVTSHARVEVKHLRGYC